MAEQYGLIEANRPEHPPINLLRVPHQNGALIVAHPAFGPNTFKNNAVGMQKQYSYPQTGAAISFRAPRTSESISTAAYNFEDMAKPEILNPRWLQLGYVRKTAEGVFFNVPKDAQENLIIDEQTLKSFLKADKKVNGIYLLGDGFAYVPRETFDKGVQSGEDFARGGLARGLECTPEQVARNLQAIASEKNYPRGVDVFGFDRDSVMRVAVLGSGKLVPGKLYVGGFLWGDDSKGGCAFGVLESAEGTAKNK